MMQCEKRNKLNARYTAKLLALTSTILLASCSTAVFTPYCPEPIAANNSVRLWLLEHRELITPAIKDWLASIAAQQQAIRENCR